MPKYIATSTPGDSRRRAPLVVVTNPDGGAPSITYGEEERINLIDGSVAYQPVGNFVVSVDAVALGETFDLVDIDTGAVLGTMTGQMLMLGMQSYYIHQAKRRDAAQGVA